jgi:hypothetical protein
MTLSWSYFGLALIACTPIVVPKDYVEDAGQADASHPQSANEPAERGEQTSALGGSPAANGGSSGASPAMAAAAGAHGAAVAGAAGSGPTAGMVAQGGAGAGQTAGTGAAVAGSTAGAVGSIPAAQSGIAGAPSKLANGDTCSSDAACASASCVGYCRAPGSVGENCDTAPDCQNGLSCVDENCKAADGQACRSDADCVSGSCFRNVCQSPGKVGSPCDSSPDCGLRGVCKSNQCFQGCAEDRECSTGSCGTEKLCQEPWGSSMNCNSDPDCLPGLYCYDGIYCQKIGEP